MRGARFVLLAVAVLGSPIGLAGGGDRADQAATDERGKAESLPGIIPDPRPIAGSRRWQVETRAPRSFLWSVAWHPAGGLIACGSSERRIRVYDARSMKLVGLELGGGRPLRWSSDGKWLASGGGDGRVLSTDGRLEARIATCDWGDNTISWSPDSKRLAYVDAGRSVAFWSPEGGEVPRLAAAPGQVSSVAWSPDGKRLALRSGEHLAIMGLDGVAGPAFACRGYSSCVAWSPDGKWLAFGSDGGTVRIAAADGSRETTVGGHDMIHSVTWSPDGTRLAAAGQDGKVRIWTRDGRAQGEFPGEMSVAWSPDGQRLIAVAPGQGGVGIWEVTGEQVASIDPHIQWVQSLVLHPDGDRLAAGTWGTVHFLDFHGNAGRVLQGPFGWASRLGWSSDGERLAAACEDGSVRLWDRGGDPVATCTGHTESVQALAWSPDGKLAASGSLDNSVRIWTRDGAAGPVIRDHADWVRAIAWSPDSHWLATGSYDRTIRLWRPDGSAGFAMTQNAIERVAWSPDGKWLASRGRNDKIHFMKADGSLGPSLDCGGSQGSSAMAWSPNGKWLAAAAAGGVRLWGADGTAGPILPAGRFNTIAWTADGQWIAGAGEDEIRVWDVDGTARFNRPQLDFMGGGPLAWSPDAKRLAVGDTFNRVRLWDLARDDEMVFVLLHGGTSVTFSKHGRLIGGDRKAAEDELVYLVEKEEGGADLLSLSQFEALRGPEK